MDPRELLTHAEFVRGLARRLVLDEHQAADIAQQTWLAALESPPSGNVPLRSWLSRVIRNFARILHRSENRRMERERVASRPPPFATPEEIAEREEARRRLVDAVLSLEEPYRTAILLRFYEDLSPREAAEHLDVPLETFRTRIKRGITRLKAGLDAAHNGNRKSWCLSFAPLAGLKELAPAAAKGAVAPAAVAAGSGPAAFFLFLGGIVMALKTKVTVAALLLAAAGLVLWHVVPDEGSGASNSPMAAGESGSSPAHGRTEPSTQADPVHSHGKEDALERIPLEADGIVFAGQVMEEETGRPVQSFHLFLNRRLDEVDPSGSSWERGIVNETVRHEDGRFRFYLEKEGIHSFTVTTSRHIPYKDKNFSIDSGAAAEKIEIFLDAGHSVSGRVLIDATGKPVADAVVGSAESLTTNLEMLLLFGSERTRHARTGSDGSFTLSGLTAERQKIAAVHADFAEGWVHATPGDPRAVTIRLKGGLRIHGKALDDRGVEKPGVVVTFRGDSIPLTRPVVTVADGTYRSPPLRPGKVLVHASAPAKIDPDQFGFTTEGREVELVDSDVEVNFGPLPEHVTWRGAFLDHKGKPQSGGSVLLMRMITNEQGIQTMDWSVWKGDDCDAEGRFEIGKLFPCRYELTLCTMEREFVEEPAWESITFDAPGVVEKDIRLTQDHDTGISASISGSVIDGLTGGPYPRAEKVWVWAIRYYPDHDASTVHPEKDGCFRFGGLQPGHYEIRTSGPHIPIECLADITLAEGEQRDGLRLVIPPHGQLRVRLTGFRDSEPRRFLIGTWKDGQAADVRNTNSGSATAANGRRRGIAKQGSGTSWWCAPGSIRFRAGPRSCRNSSRRS